jgi:hypothetical protein
MWNDRMFLWQNVLRRSYFSFGDKALFSFNRNPEEHNEQDQVYGKVSSLFQKGSVTGLVLAFVLTSLSGF